MTVQELIDTLTTFHPECQVILQKDAEGNGYSPLYAVDGNQVYSKETSYSGMVYSPEWSASDADFDDPDEWENFKANNPRCVVLAPTN